MILTVKLALLVLLIILQYQDFKDRLISLWLFPLIIGGLSYMSWSKNGYIFFKVDLLFNISLVIVQLFLLWLYFRLKGKFIVGMLGFGDVLFFMVLCFGFSTIGFIFFFCFSLLISLIAWLIINGYKGGCVPLAGIQATCLSVCIIAEIIFPSFSFEGGILNLVATLI